MGWFILGLFVGATIGYVGAALLFAAAEDRNREDRDD
jgi:gas vesicle protein